MNPPATPDGGPGYRRRLRCAAIKCLLAFFWAGWPWSLSSMATASSSGTGGCCEAADQSHRAAHGVGFRGRQFCLCSGPAVDETDATEYQRRSIFLRCLHIFGIREFPVAHLSCRDSTTETAEARTAEPAGGGAATRQDVGEHQRPVLANLSSGVLFFTPNGLVRQANASAKQILGFASPTGMSAAEIFREAELISSSQTPYANLAEAVNVGLREKTRFQRLEARYRTPTGEERTLDITVSSVHAPDGEAPGAAGPGMAGPGVAGLGVAGLGVACLGVACLINDRTEVTEIRRQEELRGEMSAEMALGLRNSLTSIAGYAQQLAASREPELARQLASDIAVEAAHLDRTIGGFLAGAKGARAGSKA